MRITPLDFQFSESQKPSLEFLSSTRKSARSSGRVVIPIEIIERYIQDWISEAEYLRLSPVTIFGKKDALSKFVWWLYQNRCETVSPRELRAFLAYVGNGHLQLGERWGNAQLTKAASPRTIQYYFSYLRGFFRWMIVEELIDDDPTRGLAVPKFERTLIQPFTSEQIPALIDAAKRMNSPLRDAAILTFMLDTGLRASEVCGLCMNDLELHTSYGKATVIGKGRKKRSVPFSRRAARDLWSYLRKNARGDCSPVLADRGGAAGMPLTRSGLQQMYERLGRVAGIKGTLCSPHTMRHTFAVNYLKRGGDVRSLQRILGHSDLKMTMGYLNIADTDIEARHRHFSPADDI